MRRTSATATDSVDGGCTEEDHLIHHNNNSCNLRQRSYDSTDSDVVVGSGGGTVTSLVSACSVAIEEGDLGLTTRKSRRRRCQQTFLEKLFVPSQSNRSRKVSSSSNRSSGKKDGFGFYLWIAVILWYSLGIISIATSKLLLSNSTGIRVSPLTLTLQQLLIGTTLLRFLLQRRCMGSNGLVTWPYNAQSMRKYPIHHNVVTNDTMVSTSAASGGIDSELGTVEHSYNNKNTTCTDLYWAGICFALGFLTTNFGFAGSAASFVETVKAAEPLTSATVAAVYGIESITSAQKVSLGTIVLGVLLSTMGNSHTSHDSNAHPLATTAATILSASIVMTSNLCFSFRGLYQKLFRQMIPVKVLDDLNLQFRMQWTGVTFLTIPVLLFDLLPSIILGRYHWLFKLSHPGSFARYILLSLVNGWAFTSYNLASTYILTRISVVHHAALNCIRRVFAIVVTSFLFGVPITLVGGTGILLAVAGFMMYTHFKTQQHNNKQPATNHLAIPYQHYNMHHSQNIQDTSSSILR